jgi:hypothetical protein
MATSRTRAGECFTGGRRLGRLALSLRMRHIAFVT